MSLMYLNLEYHIKNFKFLTTVHDDFLYVFCHHGRPKRRRCNGFGLGLVMEPSPTVQQATLFCLCHLVIISHNPTILILTNVREYEDVFFRLHTTIYLMDIEQCS